MKHIFFIKEECKEKILEAYIKFLQEPEQEINIRVFYVDDQYKTSKPCLWNCCVGESAFILR